jgi:hypothetical protein
MSRWSGAWLSGLAVIASMSACSGSSSQPDDPPVLDRIDGPARVDPSFDPFATVPATDGG